MIKLTVLICVGLLPIALLESAQTAGATAPSDDRAQRHSEYARLNRQIFHRYDDEASGRVTSLEQAKVIQSQLHQLISEEIAATLNSPTASTDDVIAGVNAVQDRAGGKPFADFFQLNGVKSLAIGYVILRGNQAIPDTQPYLEFYDQANGTWVVKAEAPTLSDFRGHTFCVSAIPSGIPGEAWFLAWGMTIGNPGTPVDVRLYAFDGNSVRTVWKRDDLTRGHVTVLKTSVTLEYDREYHSTDPGNRVHETLHITPNGLE